MILSGNYDFQKVLYRAGKIWTLAITELALINHSLYNLPLEMLFFT